MNLETSSTTADAHDHNHDRRERRDVRNRIGIGAAIAVTAGVGLAAYIAAQPDKIWTAILALSIITAIIVVAWVHRCGGQRDRADIQQDLAVVQALVQQALAEVAAVKREQRTEFDALTGAIVEAFDDLAAKVVADRRDHQTGQARVKVAEAISHLRDDMRPPDRYSVTSPTPAGGINLAAYRNRRQEEDR